MSGTSQDQVRAYALALALLDDDTARFQEILDSAARDEAQEPLIAALLSNWIATWISTCPGGAEQVHTDIDSTIAGMTLRGDHPWNLDTWERNQDATD